MAHIIMKNNMSNTLLPNSFIDHYMPNATPLYVMVYILGLRHCVQGVDGISIKDLAQALHLLESDVLNAWRYWEEKRLIKIHDDSIDNFSIEFYTIEPEQAQALYKEKSKYRINLATQPNYSPKEIDIYMERSDEIRKLFKSSESIFAKPLTYSELNMLLSFFEWYALPIEVIEVMLDYCVSNNKRGKNYLEAVARDWSENGIDTVEAANDYIDTFAIYHKILKAFGITGKTPNKKQIAFMKKWIYEFKLSIDVILEACETAFLQTGKAKFEYADTMLKDWSEKQINSIEDVKKANEQFLKNKKAESSENIKKQPPVAIKQPYKNRFINYEQREWDYAKIEEMAQSKLK